MAIKHRNIKEMNCTIPLYFERYTIACIIPFEIWKEQWVYLIVPNEFQKVQWQIWPKERPYYTLQKSSRDFMIEKLSVECLVTLVANTSF